LTTSTAASASLTFHTRAKYLFAIGLAYATFFVILEFAPIRTQFASIDHSGLPDMPRPNLPSMNFDPNRWPLLPDILATPMYAPNQF
jgi:hypothetical protein